MRFATRPSVPFENLKTIRNSFSIKDGTPLKSAAPTGQPTVAETPVLRQPDKAVNAGEVTAAVLKYAEARQKDGSRQIATILKTAVIGFTDGTLTLTLNNETQKEQFLNIRQHFMDELRLDLQNSAVQLEVALTMDNTQAKAYKPVDIFKTMSEKNPALLELKKRFDLEIDY